jgi:alcohol dehydrogenase, propanol-preferring
LCAGIIGYRSLRRASVPPGGTFGIYGFGGSAHLTAQVAVSQGIDVYVVTRGTRAQQLAMELGASWAGEPADDPPVRLDSAIVFAPAGEVVPLALAALDQHGTVALAGIHMSDIPALDYQRHLFGEKTLTSVTSNTRADGEEFLSLAEGVVRATVAPYPFERAPDALRDLAEGRVNGAAVLEL